MMNPIAIELQNLTGGFRFSYESIFFFCKLLVRFHRNSFDEFDKVTKFQLGRTIRSWNVQETKMKVVENCTNSKLWLNETAFHSDSVRLFGYSYHWNGKNATRNCIWIILIKSCVLVLAAVGDAALDTKQWTPSERENERGIHIHANIYQR